MKSVTLAGRELQLDERKRNVVIAVLPGVMLTALHSAMLDLPKTDLIDALHTDHYRIQWIIGSYILGSATGMGTTGFWGARLGMYRSYFGALALFALASGLCGLVTDVLSMTPLRLVAGYGTGLVISTAMVLFWREFPENKELAMALYGIGLFLTAVFGAALGGLLTYYLTWRWIFTLNFHLGGIAVALGLVLFPKDAYRKTEPASFDLAGFLFFALWVLTMIVVLDTGEYWGWLTSPFFVPWLLAFAAISMAFVCWGVFAPDPLINLRPFERRNYGLGLTIKSIFSINLYVQLGLISGYMIDLRGYQWWQGALVFLPGFFTMLLAMLAGAHWGRTRNRKLRMFFGMAGMALVTWIIANQVDLYLNKFLLATDLAFWGGFAGLVIGPGMLTVFERLPPADLAHAAGSFNIMRSLPTFAVGSILLILLTRQTDFNFDRMRQSITYNRPLVSETWKRAELHFSLRGSWPQKSAKQSHVLLSKWVQANARAFALQNILQYLALLTTVGPLLVLFIELPAKADSQ